uniref:Uncharacterized protein n=1 Tax=uncultured Desulfobacterium sp. TaxID=201089 RepID=E1YK41_9BACT|nr:unknown protein [uncultured Desulfobacterium sp.]
MFSIFRLSCFALKPTLFSSPPFFVGIKQKTRTKSVKQYALNSGFLGPDGDFRSAKYP